MQRDKTLYIEISIQICHFLCISVTVYKMLVLVDDVMLGRNMSH